MCLLMRSAHDSIKSHHLVFPLYTDNISIFNQVYKKLEI